MQTEPGRGLPPEQKACADEDEVIAFYTAVMRGEVTDASGHEATLAQRLKAGDCLMKRYAAAGEKNQDAIDRLDGLLEEFKHAVKSETN